jgi:hypothetical protein
MLHLQEPNPSIARKQGGGAPANGTTFHCVRCARVFSKTGHKQKWCGGCWPLVLNARRAERRARAGHIPIGVSLECRNCGTAFTKQHKRQFYCPPCSKLSAAEALPAARAKLNRRQGERNKRLRLKSPTFAINCRMSAGIGGSLRDGKGGRRWEALVDYSVADLMGHLERQFRRGMSWENRHRWHIDHIIPLSHFEFSTPEDPQFKLAWALTNLRPLWKRENLLKSGERTLLL